jgi:hypothetical protein
MRTTKPRKSLFNVQMEESALESLEEIGARVGRTRNQCAWFAIWQLLGTVPDGMTRASFEKCYKEILKEAAFIREWNKFQQTPEFAPLSARAKDTLKTYGLTSRKAVAKAIEANQCNAGKATLKELGQWVQETTPATAPVSGETTT